MTSFRKRNPAPPIIITPVDYWVGFWRAWAEAVLQMTRKCHD